MSEKRKQGVYFRINIMTDGRDIAEPKSPSTRYSSEAGTCFKRKVDLPDIVSKIFEGTDPAGLSWQNFTSEVVALQCMWRRNVRNPYGYRFVRVNTLLRLQWKAVGEGSLLVCL